MDQCEPKTRSSQVGDAVKELASHVNLLSSAIETLKKRLEQILNPIIPNESNTAKGCQTSPGTLVPLAATLLSILMTVKQSTNEVHDIIERCEL